MAVIQIALLVLLSGLVSTVLSYDKDIKIADLSACSEVIFDEGAKYFVTQHIDRFKYNSARPDEWLRMRLYYMGADGPHIGFSERARLDEERSLILGEFFISFYVFMLAQCIYCIANSRSKLSSQLLFSLESWNSQNS